MDVIYSDLPVGAVAYLATYSDDQFIVLNRTVAPGSDEALAAIADLMRRARCRTYSPGSVTVPTARVGGAPAPGRSGGGKADVA